jgi:AbrB family looped-hinge helix DNA binding protein
MMTIKVSPKFQIVIPKEIRRNLNLKPGQKLQILLFEDRVELRPFKDIKDARGLLKGMDTTIEREGGQL